jgi:hypothetical protein
MANTSDPSEGLASTFVESPSGATIFTAFGNRSWAQSPPAGPQRWKRAKKAIVRQIVLQIKGFKDIPSPRRNVYNYHILLPAYHEETPLVN